MQPGKLLLQLAVKTGLWLVIMAVALFGGAGRLDWMQGWAFLALFTLASAGFGLWLIKRNPMLLEARLDPINKEGQPLWDKMFVIVFIGLWLLWLVVMGADAQRWNPGAVPLGVNILGAVLTAIGYVVTTRVLAVNSFASPIVRVQTEREQRVIETGAYGVVRHPMYATMLSVIAGIPLLLGSWWGLLGVPVVLAGLMPRAVMEERFLRRELPGYAGYMTRVRWRLIPYVW
jgi:protein-S-isoprenylcysteine O-methyltransferase Ste14